MAGRGKKYMAGQEDMARHPGLPSAHENTATIGDHEASSLLHMKTPQQLGIMKPTISGYNIFCSLLHLENLQPWVIREPMSSKKMQTPHIALLAISENGHGDENTIPESMPYQVVSKHGPTVIVHEVGMSFESGENAYEMYNTYAEQADGGSHIFYIERKGKEKENLKAHAARLSRMATSLALKCSVSKPLLDDLERALHKLELEANHSLNKMEETVFPIISNDCSMDTANSKISYRVPQVVQGAKSKRAKNVVEKNTGKKRKSSSDKGKGSRKIDQSTEQDQDPKQLNPWFLH